MHTRLTALLIAAAATTALVACGHDKPGPAPSTTTPRPTTTAPTRPPTTPPTVAPPDVTPTGTTPPPTSTTG